MPRNTAFLSPSRPAPFEKHDRVHLEPESIKGPLPFFNPTRARFNVEREPRPAEAPSGKPSPSQVAVPQATINWRSRDNRKGATRFHCLHLLSHLVCRCSDCGGKEQADTPFE